MATMNDPSPEAGIKFIIGAGVVAVALAMATGCANRGASGSAVEAEPVVEAEPAPPPPARTAKPAPAPAPTTTARATTPAKPTATAPAAAPPAKPTTAATTTAQGTGPGMDARGNVIDSSKVEGGYGRKVKGLGDWDGEITGNAAPNSRFSKLQIGMPVRQVVDLIGPPTDQGGYVTGRAFNPFYWGSDRTRFEMAYKGQGRLVFASDGGFGRYGGGGGGGFLIWIIHNANDTGNR